ncbi:MAG TPA: LuxR C-terminal-related transcriptional regulator [Candidatus Dormibacteraeota bacterium]|nr:LuxR C-terminal-related transcriptional regulator [Candidatus Dormibacteraeota bacterium]
MSSELVDLIARGQHALAAANWDAARTSFEAALEQEETAEALDGLAWSNFWQGDYTSAIELRERAFMEFERQGRSLQAVMIACSLCFLHFAVHGNLSAALGWYARAENLVAAAGDCAERGWVMLIRSGLLPDPEQRRLVVAEAMEIGRRFADRDLEFDAMSHLGDALVRAGSINDGMSRLDEAMAAVTGGEVRGLTVIGEIYCNLLGACERAGDLKRAEQWMEVVDRFVRRLAYPGVWAICRSHYGGVLTLVGRWEEAELELVTALRLFESSYRTLRRSAAVRLADLRLRQGRIDEAGQLLEGQEDNLEALPALIGLQLARGETDWARTLVERYLAHRVEPDVFATPTIALGVDVLLAAEDLPAARDLVAQLERIADKSGNVLASAVAAAAAGRVALAGGQPATRHFEKALLAFAQVEMPLEQARTRFDLARSLATSNPKAAVAEARLAMATFQRLAAARDLDSAAKLLRELGAGGRAWTKGFGTLTGRETDVLRLLGTGMTNQQLAERLFLSRRTVEHHVANILSKLGLASRAEAAAYAMSRLPPDRATK